MTGFSFYAKVAWTCPTHSTPNAGSPTPTQRDYDSDNALLKRTITLTSCALDHQSKTRQSNTTESWTKERKTDKLRTFEQLTVAKKMKLNPEIQIDRYPRGEIHRGGDPQGKATKWLSHLKDRRFQSTRTVSCCVKLSSQSTIMDSEKQI